MKNSVTNIKPQDNAPKQIQKVKGFVGQWLQRLREICFATLFFNCLAILFATLTVYTKDGDLVESFDFVSIQWMLLPSIIPALFLFFARVDQFASERLDQAPELDGRMVESKMTNKKQIVRYVITSENFAYAVIFAVYAAYVTSFSLFFSYGSIRCETESLNQNTSPIFLLHKRPRGV